MILGEMIQELRKDKNLDQKDLARLLNVSTGTISNYETGTHTPSIENILKLADFFNVSVDYLLGNTALRYKFSNFNREAVDGHTYASIINDIFTLKSKDLRLLIDYLELLKLRNNYPLLNLEINDS